MWTPLEYSCTCYILYPIVELLCIIKWLYFESEKSVSTGSDKFESILDVALIRCIVSQWKFHVDVHLKKNAINTILHILREICRLADE